MSTPPPPPWPPSDFGSGPRPEPPPLEETDPRFPSGPWTGFFLMNHWPGRHQMDLHLSFRRGVMTGEGRDRIGSFLIRGKYRLDDGKCHWTKRYVGQHDVAYQGFNEGKGIWGLWEIPPSWKGGFHIWPEGMGDPTSPHLAEAIDAPAEAPSVLEPAPEVEVGVGVGAGVGVAEPEPVGASADLLPRPPEGGTTTNFSGRRNGCPETADQVPLSIASIIGTSASYSSITADPPASERLARSRIQPSEEPIRSGAR